MELKRTELKILRELIIDGRVQASTIARNAHLTRQMVDHGIKRLVKNGVLKNFGVVIDEAKLGYQIVQVLLTINSSDKNHEASIVQNICENPFVIWLVKCGGVYNYCLELFARDFTHLSSLLDSVAQHAGSALAQYASFVVVYQYKYTSGIGPLISGSSDVGEKKEVDYPSQKYVLTKTEQKILSYLEKDGRSSLVQIGKNTRIGADTVNYHINKLIKEKIFFNIVPHIDLLKLGYQKYIVIIHLKNVQMTKNPLKNYLQNNVFVRYAVRHLGLMQVYCLMYAESTQHFHQLLEELNTSFASSIATVEFYPVFVKYKETIFPEGLQRV